MSLKLRNLTPDDYLPLRAVVDEWWGGRAVAGLLPRLFLNFFQTTSFAVEDGDAPVDGLLVAFLVGFVSQTNPAQAYIHFVGVHPGYRAQGLGRLLYEHFFEVVWGLGCREVEAITSPVNQGSIAFHRSLGFEILPGDAEVDGVEVFSDYAGPGQPRVLFRRDLS